MANNMELARKTQNQFGESTGALIKKNAEMQQQNLQLQAELREMQLKTEDQISRMRNQY